MNFRRFLILVALFSLAVQGYGQSSAKSSGYDAYITVKTRNIFDPSRRPVRTESAGESKRDRDRRPSYFTLTGTMVAEGRSLAFFGGSRSEFSKVLPIGETVAGYKVIAITPLQAEVERDGKSFVMAVGHRLQLDGLTDEIPASELAQPATTNNSSPSPPPPGAPNSSPPAVYADKAEILRRMMERAQAERR